MKSGEDPELSAAVALVESRYRPKLASGHGATWSWRPCSGAGFAYAVVKEAIKRVEEE